MYREIRKVCGDYMFVNIFPVFPAGEYTTKSGKRKKRYKPTSEVQKALNDRKSAERLSELIHANFSSEDRILHLTFDEANCPRDIKEADHKVDLYLRRVRRLYQKAGELFKYIIIPASGEVNGRIHYHIYLSGGIDRDKIEKAWRCGWANCDRLQFNECGVSDSARYAACQIKASYRSFRCSRNITQPTRLRERDTIYSKKKVQELFESPFVSAAIYENYQGYTLSDEPYMVSNGYNGGLYMRMMLYRDDAEFIKYRTVHGYARRSEKDRLSKMQISIDTSTGEVFGI